MTDRSCSVHSWCWGASARWAAASPAASASTEVNNHTQRPGRSSSPWDEKVSFYLRPELTEQHHRGHDSQRRAALQQRLLQQVPAGRRLLLALQEDLEQLPGGLRAAGRGRGATPPRSAQLQVLKGQTQVGPQGRAEPGRQRPHLGGRAECGQRSSADDDEPLRVTTIYSGSHSQQGDVAADAQLLDEERGEGKGRSAVTEVVQEVQVLHQSEAAHQVRAGEMRQLRSL
ncbi:hypothetical protein EYF80_032304 [Liparis tanakae]|uniref:Uncharacterized protein n=1 Tax=Liparis tanakae TaxID=230148 RepID=A0A4Z2GW63_9TELE|nr:hypothetical protein EYF80_032304 [Liparis tanakae]